jgi:hypothetical protein
MRRILGILVLVALLASIKASQTRAATFCSSRNSHLAKFCFLRLDVTTRLKGGQGGDVAMGDDAITNKVVSDWTEEDVLSFLEGMREKFGPKTESYLEIFRCERGFTAFFTNNSAFRHVYSKNIES